MNMNLKTRNEEIQKNTCSVCDKEFKHLNGLKRHENTHVNNNPKNCKHCPELNFDSLQEYFIHLNEIHQGKIVDYFICSTCGRQFKTKSELTNHTRSKCGTLKLYKCEVCNQELMNPGSLYNHMRRHKGEPSFMCRFCAKLFLTAGQLKVHERIHTQEKAFVCNICGKGFCHRQSLITHSTLHTGIKPYVCENCGHAFSCVGNLLKHRKTHAECNLIPLTTHRVINPITKQKVKVNTPANSKLKEVERQRKLQKKLELLYNMQIPEEEYGKEKTEEYNHSKVKIEDVTDQKLDGNNSGYQNNDSAVNNSEDLDNTINTSLSTNAVATSLLIPHIEQSTHELETFVEDNKIVSQDCDVKIEETSVIAEVEDSSIYQNYPMNLNTVDVATNTHINDITKPKSKRKQKIPRYKITTREEKVFIKERKIECEKNINCKYCDQVYSVPVQLMQHERQCHKLNITLNNEKNVSESIDNSKLCNDNFKSYICVFCKASFINKDEWKKHQNDIHADVLTCQDCDKVFASLDSLRSHKNSFHRTYTYVCERCGKQFRQKSALLRHEQNKCGDGPSIECHVCGKHLSSIYVRKSHMTIHNAEKKLSCRFCKKSFHWKGQLKIHERRHTGEKPFTCLYCPKAFAYRESLITHSSLHTGIKPHLCEACGSRFSCIGNLIKHKATHASTCGVWYSKNKTEKLISN